MLGYLSAIRRAAPVAPPSWRRFSQQEPNGKFAGWKPALQSIAPPSRHSERSVPGLCLCAKRREHAAPPPRESLFDCDLSSIDQTTMSIETFSPLPLNIFGTWVTLLDPSDVPLGMSPNLADVDFFPGGVRTRPGLVSQFPVLGGRAANQRR